MEDQKILQVFLTVYDHLSARGDIQGMRLLTNAINVLSDELVTTVLRQYEEAA